MLLTIEELGSFPFTSETKESSIIIDNDSVEFLRKRKRQVKGRKNVFILLMALHIRHSPREAVLILRAFRGMTVSWSPQGSHQPFPSQWVYPNLLIEMPKWSIVRIICKSNALNEGLSKYLCWAWLTAFKGSRKKEELWTEVRSGLVSADFLHW